MMQKSPVVPWLEEEAYAKGGYSLTPGAGLMLLAGVHAPIIAIKRAVETDVSVYGSTIEANTRSI